MPQYDPEEMDQQDRLLNKKWPYMLMTFLSMSGFASYLLAVASLLKHISNEFLHVYLVLGTVLCFVTLSIFIAIMLIDLLRLNEVNCFSAFQFCGMDWSTSTANTDQQRVSQAYPIYLNDCEAYPIYLSDCETYV